MNNQTIVLYDIPEYFVDALTCSTNLIKFSTNPLWRCINILWRFINTLKNSINAWNQEKNL